MPFAVGDQVAVLSITNPLPRVVGGPFTVTTVMPHRTYRLSNGQIVGEIKLRPWTADTMVGEFIPGFNPQMAPAGQFAVGQQVALRTAPAMRETISGGPYLHNGVVVYETQNGVIMRRETELMVPGAVPQPPAPPPPPPPPVGQFAVGQLVRIRWAPDQIERISHGPFWHMGRISYRTHEGRSGGGYFVYPEGELIPYVPAAPVVAAAAAPANIYADIPHAGVRNVPANAENAILMNAIAPGTEMVNFHGEAGHNRYYTLNGFRQFPMKMFPGVGRFKENPHTRQPIRPANVTRYKKTGGKRRRKAMTRKNRRTRRR